MMVLMRVRLRIGCWGSWMGIGSCLGGSMRNLGWLLMGLLGGMGDWLRIRIMGNRYRNFIRGGCWIYPNLYARNIEHTKNKPKQ